MRALFRERSFRWRTRVILFSVAAAAAVSCVGADRLFGPKSPRAHTEFEPGTYELAYLCGNSFRIRSNNDTAVVARWRVLGGVDSGLVTLSPTPEADPFVDSYFETTDTDSTVLTIAGVGDTAVNNPDDVCPPSVPSIAPNGMPDSLVTSARLLLNPAALGVPIIRELVTVMFKPGTSGAERALAIASVGGTVAGGFRYSRTEGAYVIRVTDDSTGAAVAAAWRTLRIRPSVASATPFQMQIGKPTYVLPNEGYGMRSNDWVLDPNNAYAAGRAWAASVINAPFAWGCATGDGIDVGIVDLGHAVNLEIAGRTALPELGGSLIPAASGLFLAHGQRVASVLGGTANNDTGTVGIAHKATLRLIDIAARQPGGSPIIVSGTYQASGEQLAYYLDVALEAGVRIFNISLGHADSVPPLPVADSISRDNARRLMDIVRSHHAVDPIFVFSAGNLGASGFANWGTFGVFSDSLGDRAIVVTAAGSTQGQYAPHATQGGPIDLVAPGENIVTFDSLGRDSLSTGSSFAAPMVAGAAVLLLEQNPNLTAAEVRNILLSTASSSRGVGSLKMLDVYSALVKASETHGTPLCGNRVWTDTLNRFYAQRGTGQEHLFTVGVDPFDATYTNVHHGGRRVEMAFWDRYVLGGGTWSPGSWSPDNMRDYSGAFKGSGAWFQDHQDRFYTRLDGSRTSGSISFDITLTWTDPLRLDSTLTAVASAPSLTNSVTPICTREDVNDTTGFYDCVNYTDDGIRDLPTWWNVGPGGTSFSQYNVLHALDPQGRFAVALVGVRRHSSTVNLTWVPCADTATAYPAIRCRVRSVADEESWRTELYRIDLSTGAALRLDTPLIEGAGADEVFWLSISEQGTELALQVGSSATRMGTGFTCTNGRHEWLRLGASPSDSLLVAHTVNIPGSYNCIGALDGGGSSALRQQLIRR